MKTLFILNILLSTILAESLTSIQFSGVDITYKDQDISVKRTRDPRCKHIVISPENMFGGNIVSEHITKECKKTFLSSVGEIQPMMIDKDIQTVGELEVLKFLELLEFEPDLYALIDSRKTKWFKQATIPNATNIPYNNINEDTALSSEYANVLSLLNIKKDKYEKLDFTNAKQIIIFCNANWCVQSVWAIKSLIKMGYPKDKISWYRGGIEDWIRADFTTIHQ